MVLNGVHALLEPATLWTEPAAQKPTDNPVYMTYSSVLFVACANFAGLYYIAFGDEINRSMGSVFCVCVS